VASDMSMKCVPLQLLERNNLESSYIWLVINVRCWCQWIDLAMRMRAQ
jgi:hypothetical protein